jgi:hypothetical protein
MLATISVLSPEPHQNGECTKQPRDGREERANDCAPHSVACECGKCKSQRGDARDNEQPGRSRGPKKRRKLVHRRLVLLTSQRLALSIESNTPEFELIKAALAAKHGIRRIARELQTGVGTVLRIKSELAAA